jgi:hypothetical protein
VRQRVTTERPSFDTALRTARSLEAYWRQRNDTSFDPYDGLETERLAFLSKLPRPAQLAVVQLNKRSPVNLRALEGVRPTRNSYTVAHFASAGAAFFRAAGDGSALAAMADRLDWLCSHRVQAAWAYPFDVQTKTFAYLKTTPNVICTAFSVEALLDGLSAVAGQASYAERRARWSEAVAAAVEWVLEHLHRKAGARQYFCYVPAERLLIHNANVLAARFVARAARTVGNDSWLETACACLAVTVREIGPDGLLPYGEGSREAWVDGHHTGFVAEALLDLSESLSTPGLRTLADRVRAGYRRSLFEADGRPLLYPGKRFPIDVITGAQGIQTFAKAGGEEALFAQAVAGFMLTNMRTRSGTFVFRQGRVHRKAVPYVRWSDAPMCLALAKLALALGNETVPVASRQSAEGGSRMNRWQT